MALSMSIFSMLDLLRLNVHITHHNQHPRRLYAPVVNYIHSLGQTTAALLFINNFNKFHPLKYF